MYLTKNRNLSCVQGKCLLQKAGTDAKNRNFSRGLEPTLYHLDSEQMVPQYLWVEKNHTLLERRMGKSDL